MSSEDILLFAGPVLRLLAVFILGGAVLVLLQRKSPEWRVATVRVTMVALPVALLLGFSNPAILIPVPQVERSTESEDVRLPRKGGLLGEPWVGATLFPVDDKESEAASTANEKGGTIWSFLKSRSFEIWLIAVWMIGFIIMLSRELLGAMILHRRRSDATPVSSSLLSAWKDANPDLGFDVPDNSILQLPDETVSPYLTPWPLTRLMIPSRLEERFSEAEIGHLFRHEAAHRVGRDPAALLMMRLSACLLWFFPGAWWLARKHLDLCEECADARAARVGGVDGYREAIASFALEFVPSKSTRVMALLKKATVVDRLKVLSGNVAKRQPSVWKKWGLILVLFSSLAGIGRVGLAEIDESVIADLLPPIDRTPVPLISTGSSDGPHDMWYRGFLKVQNARELEESGASDVDLVNLYEEALVIYELLASEHPTYLPAIVTERIYLIREKLADIKARLRSGSGAAVHLSPAALAEPVLRIRGVSGNWNVDVSQGRKITFVVEIVSDSNDRINSALVSLTVRFYELVAGTELEPSIASIQNRFPTGPYDWKDGEVETMEIDYFLPKEKAADSKREYYGRIFELHYNGILQYVDASPSKLDRLVK